MDKMYFSVPYGTRELSFGIMDDEGCELWNFYVVFIESVTMYSRQVIVYGDCNNNGTLVEKKLAVYDDGQDKDVDNQFMFGFDSSEGRKVIINVSMSRKRYFVHVKY